MIKKAILWTVFAALVGVLVVGATIRTLDKTEQASSSGSSGESAGRGRGAENDAAVRDWLTREGTVAGVDEDALTVQLTTGETLVIEGRALSFSHEQAFATAIGDHLALVGFDEDGDFEVARIENLTTGQIIALRDDSGHPLWSGRGRGQRGT